LFSLKKPKSEEKEKEEEAEDKPRATAEEKGKKKQEEGEGEKQEKEEKEEEAIAIPDNLNVSLAELTSSSEDDSITWEANEEGEKSEASEAEGNKDPFDSDHESTFILPKPSDGKLMEQNDNTFVLPPRKKSSKEDLSQTIVMGSSDTQKMSDLMTSVYLIPSLKGSFFLVLPRF